MIQLHPEYTWDWHEISLNMKITTNDLINNPNFPWDFDELSKNKNLTIDMLQKFPDKPWNYQKMGGCPFAIDKQIYITHQFANILLLQIHEYCCEHPREVVCMVGRILFDDYLLKNVIKY